MKPVKIFILLFAVVGIVGMFLPYFAGANALTPEGFKLFDLRSGNEPIKLWLPLAGFVLPILIMVFAFVKGGLARWHAIIAFLGFGIAAISKEVREGMLGYSYIEGMKLDTGLGGKLLFVAAAGGLLFSLIGLIKPER